MHEIKRKQLQVSRLAALKAVTMSPKMYKKTDLTNFLEEKKKQ